jgi:hypothetical protein
VEHKVVKKRYVLLLYCKNINVPLKRLTFIITAATRQLLQPLPREQMVPRICHCPDLGQVQLGFSAIQSTLEVTKKLTDTAMKDTDINHAAS